MSTLTYTDVIQRVGYTVIDNVRVVQYTCTIPLDKPENIRITSTRLNPDLYKANKDVCRKDLAAFEDAAWLLQEQYLKNKSE